jgi:small multidrug resistance family-3 protein
MGFIPWLVFLCAAVLEVGGDAIIRRGLHRKGWMPIAVGFVALGCYGLLVNTVRWDFSRLLGVSVAVFAVVSILAGLGLSVKTMNGKRVFVCRRADDRSTVTVQLSNG